MAYIPNPQDATNPTDVVPAETAAPEFRALKAYLQSVLGNFVSPGQPLRGYIAGLILSNDGGGPTTTVDISAGEATSDDHTIRMYSSVVWAKTTAAWAAGNGNGGLDTGAVADNTWYHVFMIQTAAGLEDFILTTTVVGPVMPATYVVKRRIGSVLTDGSGHIIAFIQDGDYFRWKASVADVTATNPGTAAVTAVLASVPLGINVQAIFNLNLKTSTTAYAIYVSDLAANDEVPNGATADPAAPGNTLNNELAGDIAMQIQIRTNTAQSIRYRLSASGADTKLGFITLGWIDSRGKNS